MPSLTQRIGLPRYAADLRYKEALAAYTRDQVAEAIEHMNAVIGMLPTHAEYWAARGMMYLRQSQMEAGKPPVKAEGPTPEQIKLASARADFERAVKLFELEMLGHYGLGMVALREERCEEALMHLQTALSLDPDRPETLYTLALVLDKLDRSTEALEAMTRAHDLMEEGADKRKPQAVRWLAQLRKRAK
jgi:Flp pilus assembly protein TadD